MEPSRGAGAGSGATAADAPAHLRWDIAEMTSHECSLATASATPAEVVLNFGMKRPRGSQTRELGPELARRIALSPLTAKNLAATLRRLIDERDGRSR